MNTSLNGYKIKIFDKYLQDTGSTYDSFLKEKNLIGATEEDISKVKIQIIDEAIEIMGKDELFKNYLSEEEFKAFKESEI